MRKEIMQEDSGRSGLPAGTMRMGREAVTALLNLVIIHRGDRCWRGDVLVQVSQGNAVCLCNIKVWVRVSTSQWNKKTQSVTSCPSINCIHRGARAERQTIIWSCSIFTGVQTPCCEPVEDDNQRHLVRYKLEVLAIFSCLFPLLPCYNSKGNIALFTLPHLCDSFSC